MTALSRQLDALLPGLAVESVTEIDSTNSELMRRARAGRLEPVLLLAQRQTAGRGRLGRQWLGEPGASLTFSLGLLLAPPDWSGLSLAAGVAVAEALHPAVRLKWPNDLWVQDRKLGGILIETAAPSEGGPARYTIVGLGLNLAPREGDAYATPPCALRELLPKAAADAVLQQVAPPLLQAVLGFEQFGFAPFQARFEARDALAGRSVRLSDGMVGSAHGVDTRGALLVHTAAGMKAVATAEVSVRPA
ncbi:biotin--[acetyl-CoA-carboxylase] ligase [Ramlibacter tataouinensis]|uniref:biotin--[acetyl-CoA-carboxylase] ligase n=1 Tax=Ramlibacter tataouinensis TaxID=94132 RepID=UPI0022F38D43|nr:biotin--[acetyl-CoA-carboxylase] ligase [Ramlibacter tataouinensis]WBY00091.1 biotin--[acetyl-CoA-carboxylase] ligase [Ramlibacter tataouinensis]